MHAWLPRRSITSTSGHTLRMLPFHAEIGVTGGHVLGGRESIQLAVGGPLVGLAFGAATTVWLRYMYNSAPAEITLTIVSAPPLLLSTSYSEVPGGSSRR